MSPRKLVIVETCEEKNYGNTGKSNVRRKDNLLRATMSRTDKKT
jgi:hypothetical protein